jgi:AcrR family transcriptional regulator
MAKAQSPVPRGRHAPPREVREELQRERLFEAACRVFSASGYADASAEAISRAAGMSKATFYEHFGNKKDCLLEIMNDAASRSINELILAARTAGEDPLERHRAGLHAFMRLVASQPDLARTALVVSIGAGPEAVERREALIEGYAQILYDEAREGVEKRGGGQRYASVEDAVAVIGATVELMSRQLRSGRPARMEDLEPVVERLLIGILTDPDG